MDVNFTREQEKFRLEVREFLTSAIPPKLADKIENNKPLLKEDMQNWHDILNKKGWLASSWPKEYNGTGWGVVEQFIFEDELAAANAPRTVPFGLRMLAPVLMKFGTKDQCNYWLPRILDGSDWWCQGYSEPGSGSDLASLKTSAVKCGDQYLVNGQKTWTTLAQHANMIFNLVRTSNEGKPQQGISFLMIDMNSPGIEVRPIKTIDGGHEVNEVWFSDVRVPAENLIGEENKGWTYAKYLLSHERNNIATVGISKKKLEKLKVIAKNEFRNGLPLIKDPLFAARLARLEISLLNMETTNLRVLSESEKGGDPGAESSMLKILGSEICQELDHLQRRAAGRFGRISRPEALEEGFNGEDIGPFFAHTASSTYFNNRKVSIYGGSNEIQKNIITKMIIGL
ncbi:MAG: pimeloyl-CoA dehydrogenase large subunit [Rhodobacteraceae bacterium]|jgi:alkylation response protein AidB-like acyl-CoA dehydrogenase|nr:pimeloyl-CoA dehydrogenase large subunit [Paracoccaceae bacterium]MBV03610.1 pimeloyl-CoA dehydrogenase large subunit [Paracoccaceae bacterium]MDC0039899.1 acyl-CoA dehydrogenase family protein [Paracoccaceae bacterium]MDG1879288.1 acyl-CoA dehydrogenase family protein [Paracoccaceae bacterium]MDG1939531.1 acyl-CoA dehydrogenase family protein [Paracoccaceae bacterium]|tara:strand:+ start:2226 stop:3422 length:1197 start_codon:yes stop_codon:yes gene_type:complete